MKKSIIFLLIFLLLTACSNDDEEVPQQENDEQEQPEQSEVVEKDENENEDGEEEEEGYTYKNVFPLTGIGTDEEVNHRTIGVMINNHVDARPQSGLSEADIVFELLSEGPITRFLALFHSERPEMVGPVRSAREYYFDLANRYDAIYVYHGAAEVVNDMIVNRGIDYINGSIYDNDGNIFRRESFRVAPHNSYLLFENVYDVAERHGYEITSDEEPLQFLDEKAEESIQGDEAKHIEIIYSSEPMEIVEYEYDEQTEKYYRYNDREQTVEWDTEIPIQMDNVFIIETDHAIADDSGRRSIDLYAGGDAYLIQKGKIQSLQWENRDGKLVPVKDGEVVGFVPGQTWINVVPTDPGMEQSIHVTNN